MTLSAQIDPSISSPNDKTKPRKLDDKELDSGDDQERLDRLSDDAGDDNKEERAETILDVKIGRHAIPRPSDKEVRFYICKLSMPFDSILRVTKDVFASVAQLYRY